MHLIIHLGGTQSRRSTNTDLWDGRTIEPEGEMPDFPVSWEDPGLTTYYVLRSSVLHSGILRSGVYIGSRSKNFFRNAIPYSSKGKKKLNIFPICFRYNLNFVVLKKRETTIVKILYVI